MEYWVLKAEKTAALHKLSPVGNAIGVVKALLPGQRAAKKWQPSDSVSKSNMLGSSYA